MLLTYSIGYTGVTQEPWETVMENNPSPFICKAEKCIPTVHPSFLASA